MIAQSYSLWPLLAPPHRVYSAEIIYLKNLDNLTVLFRKLGMVQIHTQVMELLSAWVHRKLPEKYKTHSIIHKQNKVKLQGVRLVHLQIDTKSLHQYPVVKLVHLYFLSILTFWGESFEKSPVNTCLHNTVSHHHKQRKPHDSQCTNHSIQEN